jgi:predicted nucleotidyltransferase
VEVEVSHAERITSTAAATPYPELNAVLGDLVTSVQVVLDDSFVGAYLQGSFAIGDFDRHSDVDFVIAVSDELSDHHVAGLQAMHERVYGLDSVWAQHLEGSYFPAAILRDDRRRAEPLWYLDHGSRSLERSDHCNTLVVRWVVRERGIRLAGPDPTALVDPIPVDALRREMGETMRSWGAQILDQPARYRNRFYQGFIVLNYCRMLHDLVEGRPGSKRAGAAWAKATLDPEWCGLIDRAWKARPDPAVAVREPPDAVDFESTLRFVKSVIRASERYAVDDPAARATVRRACR